MCSAIVRTGVVLDTLLNWTISDIGAKYDFLGRGSGVGCVVFSLGLVLTLVILEHQKIFCRERSYPVLPMIRGEH